MNRKNSKNKIQFNFVLIAFLLSLILGMIIVVPHIIKGHGIFNVFYDFSIQQIPFNISVNKSLKEGSFLWSWYNDLGSNFIGSFSFYNLFSPFNMIGYLFPATWFPYLVGPIFILKYAVAGLTSYLFIKRYVKDEKYAILASVLYAFSGFQFTNTLFYHFHDVVALFPLLLYSLDKLMYENKKGLFTISVALLAITNFFFFIGQVIFVIIYYIIKILTKSYKFTFKSFINLAIEAVLGVGLSSLVLIPSILFTISNPRINGYWNLISMIKYMLSQYLHIIRSVIFPSEIMSATALVFENDYSSTELFLPFVGAILSIAYFLKNHKEWDSILLLVLCFFIFIPILNSSFFAFVTAYYSRWFYMLTLILALTSAKCLDRDCKITPGIILNILIIILFAALSFLYCRLSGTETIIYNPNYFKVMIVTTIICLVLLLILDYIKSRKSKEKLLFLFVCIFVCFWGNYTTYKYKALGLNDATIYKNYIYINEKLKFDKIVRTNSSINSPFNYGYLTNTNNIKNFNSNINGSLFKFYNSIGIVRDISTNIPATEKILNDFLGVEYIIAYSYEDLSYLGYEIDKEVDNYIIYKNPDYKNLGFNVHKYISQEEFEKLEIEERREILVDTVVLTDEQIEKYKEIILKQSDYLSNEYEFINNGFKSIIESNGTTLAIYTIPYDKGWKAYNNGKETKIEEIDNGFMGVKINEGINNIEFKYFPVGLKSGIIISINSLLGFIIYIMFSKRGSKK